MVSNVKEVLNHLELKEKKEKKLNPKSKIAKKYNTKKSKFPRGWQCHIYYNFPKIDNNTVFIYFDDMLCIKEILWEELKELNKPNSRLSLSCNKEIHLIKNIEDFTHLESNLFAISQFTLNKLENKLNQKLIHNIRIHIERMKFLLLYKSKYPRVFAYDTHRGITLYQQYEKYLLSIFIDDNYIDLIDEFISNEINFEYIVYETINSFTNNTYSKFIIEMFEQYKNKRL